MLNERWTTGRVIDTLGGNNAVSRLTGRSYNAVCNWRSFKDFPPSLYILMSQALAERGFTVSPDLWAMEKGPKVAKPRGRPRKQIEEPAAIEAA